MTISEQELQRRRAYGRGYVDGLRARSPTEASKMTPSRIEALERGLNGVARKVLDTIPGGVAWSKHAIGQALGEKGSHIERTVLDGCIAHLITIGLVTEEAGGYQRVVKPRAVRVPKPEEPKQEAKAAEQTVGSDAPAPQKSPLDRFGELAADARAMSLRLSELAAAIEAAALDAEQSLLDAKASGERLAALRKLLREEML